MKLGPLRMNFSNSGISYSTGVRGARISTGPRGTYVTIGANGIYYRQKIGGVNAHRPGPVTVQDQGLHTITSADIGQLTDVDSRAFIEELSEKAGKISFVKWLGVWPMIIFLVLLSYYSVGIREVVLEPAGKRNVVRIDSYVGCNIRVLSAADAKILGTAKDAEEFPLLDSTIRGWLKISFQDSIGYVSKKLARTSIIDDPGKTTSEFYLINPYYFWILGVGIVLFSLFIRFLSKVDRKRFEMELTYEMDEQMGVVYSSFAAHFNSFNSCIRKWQYLNTQQNHDWKRNAGAGRLINRVPIYGISSNALPIRYFKTNVAIPHIKLRNTQLFFLPERLLIRRGDRFAAVFYRNLHIDQGTTRFIEDEIVPSDARVVDHTWKCVNRNGGPDRRFNNNREIPICLYSQYTLRSATGVYETICTSRIGAFDGFGNYLLKIGALQSRMGAGTTTAQ
ncbi:DUF4236 domain-containing protein [Pedobacter sp. 22226]|uniref:DUF4236 domain-containing protein n=1 Tax=Pedobacter sp. 22226 TaxID=3453894 RepID=UPI003F82EA4E